MKSTQKTIFIQIKNDFSELAKVSQLFEQFSETHQLPLKFTNPVNLALDEILNNIIAYGYDDDKEHKISIEVSLVDQSIKLKIEDDGIPFNPLDLKEADTTSGIQERAVGGLGIHLLRNMLDKLSYGYINNKNCLFAEKNIREL